MKYSSFVEDFVEFVSDRYYLGLWVGRETGFLLGNFDLWVVRIIVNDNF
jgi:hypothetical protein